jgi:hypothetical protein
MQASRTLVDAHFATTVLVTDATGCMMNFQYLMLMLPVHYTSQHFLLALHTAGWE